MIVQRSERSQIEDVTNYCSNVAQGFEDFSCWVCGLMNKGCAARILTAPIPSECTHSIRVESEQVTKIEVW